MTIFLAVNFEKLSKPLMILYKWHHLKTKRQQEKQHLSTWLYIMYFDVAPIRYSYHWYVWVKYAFRISQIFTYCALQHSHYACIIYTPKFLSIIFRALKWMTALSEYFTQTWLFYVCTKSISFVQHMQVHA